jgi:hypothetical protein
MRGKVVSMTGEAVVFGIGTEFDFMTTGDTGSGEVADDAFERVEKSSFIRARAGADVSIRGV